MSHLLTNEQILTDYFIYLQKNYNARSVDAYQREIKRFFETFTSQSVITIEESAVRDYLEGLAQQLNSKGEPLFKPSSLRHNYSTLNNFFAYLQQLNLRQDNPMATIKFGKAKRNSEVIDYLEKEEIEGLIEMALELNEDRFVGLRDAVVIQLMAETGMRSYEVMSMTFSQLDLDRQEVIAINKEGQLRRLNLSDGLVQRMRAYLDKRQRISCGKATKHLVFVSRRGGNYTNRLCHGALTRYSTSARLTKRASSTMLRHTYAYHQIQAGETIEQLSQQLGHASIYITQDVYQKWLQN